MKDGKLIVFEGIDGSGKSTQYSLLCEALRKKGMEFKNIVFPQYSEESSALIKMYLRGEFGDKPGEVNAYAASSFFAVDRYASFKKTWGEYYFNGGLIVTDRYTTSNAVHQASKLRKGQRGEFFSWLYDFEYNKLGMPAPDKVIYMDVSLEVSCQQLRKREEATGTNADIHEKDRAYLENCLDAARDACKYYGWDRLNCLDGNGKMRPLEDIHAEVLRKLADIFV